VRDGTAAAVRAAYSSSPWPVRLHIAGRWRSCPFPEVAAAVPAEGDILDAGCGHGVLALYLAIDHPARRIVGVDIDERKLPEGRSAAESAGVADRVTLAGVPKGWDPGADTPRPTRSAGWDAIVCVDMLYLLGLTRACDWLCAAAAALAPGGRLVVKELDTHPAWKHRVSRVQEVLATRVLHITRGDTLELVPRDDVEGAMRAAGLEIEGTRLDRGRLHPHYLVVGTKPG
jgi:cyclopropane fatty-acyl-phospholipid synthase-like methyltransferase